MRLGLDEQINKQPSNQTDSQAERQTDIPTVSVDIVLNKVPFVTPVWLIMAVQQRANHTACGRALRPSVYSTKLIGFKCNCPKVECILHYGTCKGKGIKKKLEEAEKERQDQQEL